MVLLELLLSEEVNDDDEDAADEAILLTELLEPVHSTDCPEN